MKTVIKIACVSGAALLLSGCTGTTGVENKYPFDINKRYIAQYDEDSYYSRPEHTWSYRLTANNAHINTIVSSELITCKKDDIWFISTNEFAEEEKIRYRYFITFSKADLMEIEDNSTYIPRRDSKEFNDLLEIDTQMAKQGLIGCSSKLPKEEVEKNMPKSDAITIPAS